MIDAVERLSDWENRLRSRTLFDQVMDEAKAVREAANANAETCWQAAWRIPLFANTTVSHGLTMISRLEPYMEQAWRTWGQANGPICITYKGGSNKTENFILSGSQVSAINKCKVARHRLFAIQGAASGIRQMVDASGERAPFAAFAEKPLKQLVPELMQQFGRGWGPITVLHLLTDFGLAVKPDLHLVRTVQSLGLLEGFVPARVPNLREALAITSAVKELAEKVYGKFYSARDLRKLDGLLMEASRQRLLT